MVWKHKLIEQTFFFGYWPNKLKLDVQGKTMTNIINYLSLQDKAFHVLS